MPVWKLQKLEKEKVFESNHLDCKFKMISSLQPSTKPPERKPRIIKPLVKKERKEAKNLRDSRNTNMEDIIRNITR